MSLLKLPAELQLAIARLLPDPANICAVHPRLYRVTQGLLYSNVNLTWEIAKPFPSIMNLLRTLVARPDLRQEVRTINLKCDRYCQVDAWTIQRESRLSDNTPDISQDALVAELQSLGFTGPDFVFASRWWANQVVLGNADAIVALIVAMTPNIQQLSLSCSWGISHRYLGFVFKMALCPSYRAANPHRLPKYDKLTSVSLTPMFIHRSTECNSPVRDDILALFYLPNIEELEVPIASRLEMSWPDKRAPMPLSLRSLKIYRLREKHLGPILSVCSSLRSLHYKWCLHDAIDRPLGEAPPDLDEMATAIVTHCGHTLKVLQIDAATPQFFYPRGNARLPEPQVLGSLTALSGLAALEHMILPAQFVYGFSLPPTPDGVRRVIPKDLHFFQVVADTLCYHLWCLKFVEYGDALGAEVFIDGLLCDLPELEVVCLTQDFPAKFVDTRGHISQLQAETVGIRFRESNFFLWMNCKARGDKYKSRFSLFPRELWEE